MADRYNVYVKKAVLTTDDITATKLFDLPGCAIPIGVRCHVAATATNATLTVGDAATAAKYLNALSVATAGMAYGSLLNIDGIGDSPKPIYGLIGGSPSSGGPFTVIMEYVVPKSTRVL